MGSYLVRVGWMALKETRRGRGRGGGGRSYRGKKKKRRSQDETPKSDRPVGPVRVRELLRLRVGKSNVPVKKGAGPGGWGFRLPGGNACGL